MDSTTLRADLSAAAAMTMIAVPQGVAYALIAGLPPAAGLYATAVPTMLGALFRSSRHVITGPTNAVSLLVGSALAAGTLQGEPVQIALQLALLVGLFQTGAGLLRLGAIVDYISRPVVLGYITGAGLLIGLGQLGNITGTSMGKGDPFTRVSTWIQGLPGVDPRSVALAGGTLAVLLLLRRYAAKVPGAAAVLGLGIVLSWAFDFQALGLATAGDLAPVPAGLPPFTLPSFEGGALKQLLPAAIAITVLSLVESSAVARSIAAESGQRLNMNREFFGQGIGNLGAAFTGGYPVSGSLSRSALNYRTGAKTRFSGVAAGLMMLGVLILFGPVVDLTPIACLAGLLLVVAWDLVDRDAIRAVAGSLWGDRLAFAGTVIGTWTLPLDTAIYLGVAISLVLFLWRARYLNVTEMVVTDGTLQESHEPNPEHRCNRLRVLHIEGNLFFGASNELQETLDDAVRDPDVKVLVLRLKRARGLDFTSAGVLIAMRARLEATGRHLLLAGMNDETMKLFDAVGLSEAFGTKNLFPTEHAWFVSINHAMEYGQELAGICEACPLKPYLQATHVDAPIPTS